MPLTRRAFTGLGLGAFTSPLRAIHPRPKLTIVIACEQFRSDYLDRTEPFFSPGGFRRLIVQGAFLPNCEMAASTFRMSSLATLLTGAWPQLHGIVADRWFDRQGRRLIQGGRAGLESTTIAEEVEVAGGTRTFVIAPDETTAALTGAGTRYYCNAAGEVVASRGAPEWLRDWRGRHDPGNFHNAFWIAAGAKPGSPPLRTLAWDPAAPGDFLRLYRSSPFAQENQMDLLRELIARESMGQGPTFDFVVVLLDASALLGYETGADSPLMDQMVIQLDRQLEATIAAAEDSAGADNFNVIFAGAHGAPRVTPRVAVSGERLARDIDRVMSERLDGPGPRKPYVERYVYPYLYLKPAANVRVAAEAAMQDPGVEAWYAADGACSHAGELRRYLQNSFHPGRCGDLMLSYLPGRTEDYGARGISYGSLHRYDTRVPLVFWGPQFRSETVEDRVELIDLAATVARVCGAGMPSACTGRVLGAALA